MTTRFLSRLCSGAPPLQQSETQCDLLQPSHFVHKRHKTPPERSCSAPAVHNAAPAANVESASISDRACCSLDPPTPIATASGAANTQLAAAPFVGLAPRLQSRVPSMSTLLQQSAPYIMTVLEPDMDGDSADAAVVYQNKQSCNYWADRTQCNSGSQLASFIRELFHFEGEDQLRDMLRKVLEPDEAFGEDGTWTRVIQVPASCGNEVTQTVPGSVYLSPTGQGRRSSMPVLAHAQPRSSTLGRDAAHSDFGGIHPTAQMADAAAATSVAVRQAPRRVRTLLDISIHQSVSTRLSSSPLSPSRKTQGGSTSSNLQQMQSSAAAVGSLPDGMIESGSGSNTTRFRTAQVSDSNSTLPGNGHGLAFVQQVMSEDSTSVPPQGAAARCSGPRPRAANMPMWQEHSAEALHESSSSLAQARQSNIASASRDASMDDVSCWHEIFITRSFDTPDGRPLLLVYQHDVSVRTRLEVMMARMTETQLGMLCQLFPRHVMEMLSVRGNTSTMAPEDLADLARSHQDVSILFMDIVGFTNMSKQVAAGTVMTFLNELFLVFDALCDVHSVYKVETAGDCYIVSSGLLTMDAEGFAQVCDDVDARESAARLLEFACDMLRCSRQVTMPHDGTPVNIRIGIHTGPCVSGVIGSKLPKFSIFGDTMNTASRMESTCVPGRLQISATTYELLVQSGATAPSDWEPSGGVEVKGKGTMETYLWREPPESTTLVPVSSPHLPADVDDHGRSWISQQLGHMQSAGSSGEPLRQCPPHIPASQASSHHQAHNSTPQLALGDAPSTRLSTLMVSRNHRRSSNIDFRTVGQLMLMLADGTAASNAVAAGGDRGSVPRLGSTAFPVGSTGSGGSSEGLQRLGIGQGERLSTCIMRALQNPAQKPAKRPPTGEIRGRNE